MAIHCLNYPIQFTPMSTTMTWHRTKFVVLETGLPAVDSSDIDGTITTGKQVQHSMSEHQIQPCNDLVFYCSYNIWLINHLGECCNHVNIQSDGPASEVQYKFMGDYEKIGNDSNVYKNIMYSDGFLYRYVHKSIIFDNSTYIYWRVCTK